MSDKHAVFGFGSDEPDVISNVTNEEDFKFVIQDVSQTQIGVRYTFEELLMTERVPFKFQSIIQLYLLKLVEPDVQIGNHILNITDSDFAYKIYDQLKLKVKFCEPKKNGGYKVVSLAFKKFKDYQSTKWTSQHVLQDITLSNLALMAFKI